MHQSQHTKHITNATHTRILPSKKEQPHTQTDRHITSQKQTSPTHKHKHDINTHTHTQTRHTSTYTHSHTHTFTPIIMSLRAAIPRNVLINNDHTEFHVEIYDGTSLLTTAKLRYSQFGALHENLTRSTSSFPVPELPPKKYFGRTNANFVRERQQQLEVFLNGIIRGINKDAPKAKIALAYLCRFMGTSEEVLKKRVPSDSADNGGGMVGNNNQNDQNGNESQLAAGGFDLEGVNNSGQDETKRLDEIIDHFLSQTINVNFTSGDRTRRPKQSSSSSSQPFSQQSTTVFMKAAKIPTDLLTLCELPSRHALPPALARDTGAAPEQQLKDLKALEVSLRAKEVQKDVLVANFRQFVD